MLAKPVLGDRAHFAIIFSYPAGFSPAGMRFAARHFAPWRGQRGVSIHQTRSLMSPFWLGFKRRAQIGRVLSIELLGVGAVRRAKID